MKKVFCDNRISVWQQGDLFVGTGATLRPKKSEFDPINKGRQFSSVEDAAKFANDVRDVVDEFLDFS